MKKKNKNYLDIKYYDNNKRPVLLILPGGGYGYTSEREADPIVDEFIKIKYHQAVFYYREEMLKYPLILDDAIKHINSLKEDPLISDIYIMGFSAGGHLAGLLLTKFPEYFKKGVLCYPVVSTREDAIHEGSFMNLLIDYPNHLEDVSLPNLVNENTPPIYMWHTNEDITVPSINSILLKEALDKYNVLNKLTLFEKGHHGLSLVFEHEVGNRYDDVKRWIEEAKDWLIND